MLGKLPWSVLGGRSMSGFCLSRSLFRGPIMVAPSPLRHGRGCSFSPYESTLWSKGSLFFGLYGPLLSGSVMGCCCCCCCVQSERGTARALLARSDQTENFILAMAVDGGGTGQHK